MPTFGNCPTGDSLSPQPSTSGRGGSLLALDFVVTAGILNAATTILPLLRGEGWGEGDEIVRSAPVALERRTAAGVGP